MNNRPLKNLLAEKSMYLVDLARMIGVDKSTVTRWDQGRIPAERVLDIERVTGVSRSDLRPDLYPTSKNESRSA